MIFEYLAIFLDRMVILWNVIEPVRLGFIGCVQTRAISSVIAYFVSSVALSGDTDLTFGKSFQPWPLPA